MDVPDNLLCVFSARVEERRDSYVIEVPKHEVTTGDVQPGAVYRTALLATGTEAETEGGSPVTRTKADAETRAEVGARTESGTRANTGARAEGETETETGTKSEANAGASRGRTEAGPDREPSGPPVEEGEVREVEIEDIGDQGDGIARVERGYVIIVPETDEGDRVTIEITNVRENVGFGKVVE
jgi:predicted RNA-binding protein with TRAM domain